MHKAIISMSTVLVPALWHRKAKLTQEQEDLKIYQRLSLLIKKLGFFWDSLGFPKWFMGFSWVNMEITWFFTLSLWLYFSLSPWSPRKQLIFFGGEGEGYLKQIPTRIHSDSLDQLPRSLPSRVGLDIRKPKMTTTQCVDRTWYWNYDYRCL